ncbi:DUF6441 family protein [Azospirillum picis]|uniref:Uncharacterized protein n=1 Tax=Azospirillum picis TaxID=488438 RepID=A0ABU0MED7_9PROT|nr:DUF6441 family protein [Azospirillum picis]MBP2297950.1 hypothetical protein [Azospirillum picis]MDQ0531788.1 hypothetical protein [Azospirillum picis]
MIVGRLSGDVKDLVNAGFDDIADAARAAVRSASEALQTELRRQTRAAGLGSGLEKAWRLELYPKTGRRTLRPAGLVFSKATRLHDAFDSGETITARGSKWLAIPLAAAKELGFDKMEQRPDSRRASLVPAKWSNVAAAESHFGGTLRFIPIGNGARALLVAEGKARGDRLARGGVGRATSIPLFLLVRRVRGRKLLDISAATRAAEAQLASNLSNILGR